MTRDLKRPSSFKKITSAGFSRRSELWGLPLFITLFAITFTLLVILVTIYQAFGTDILPAAAVFIFLSAIFWIIDPLLKERLPAVVSSIFLTAIYLGFAQFLIYSSNGLDSPFFLVYYFVVFTGAMAFGLTGALAVTLVVAIAYASFLDGIESVPYYISRILVLWIISLMVGFLAETKKRIERREALQNLRLAALEEIALFMRELSRPEDVIDAALDAALKLLDADEVVFEKDERKILAKERAEPRRHSGNARTVRIQVVLQGATHHLVIRRRAVLSPDETRIIRLLLEKTCLICEHLQYRAIIENVRMEKERVLDSIGSGVVTIGDNGNVKSANRRALEILGYTTEEIRKVNFAVEIAQSPELREWRGESREVALFSKEQEEVPAAMKIFPEIDEHGATVGQIVVFDDLKEIRRLEAVLRRSESLAAVGEMSSRIAHEIRNPLGGIMGFLGLAEKDAPENVRYYIRESSQAVARLEKTVQDLLTFSMTAAGGSSQFACADAWALLERRMAMENSAAMGVSFHLAPLPENFVGMELRGGLEQFEQVAGNLLKNAIEAVAPEGNIEIRARWGGPVAWIEVSDSGPGCPDHLAGRIFEPFVSGKASGSGLGLAIAKKIVDALGGTIRYERTSGAQKTMTRFRVAWPVVMENSPSRAAAIL